MKGRSQNMKFPNGFGGITKLKGKRRKPYMVRITKGWTLTENGKQKQIYQTLGYFEKRTDAIKCLTDYHKNPFDNNVTFNDIFLKWSNKHFEKYPSSKGGIMSAYKKCTSLYDMKMIDIKKVHLQNIIDTHKDQSIESQTKIKTIFLNVFKFALENDLITKDYSQFVTLHERPKTKKNQALTDNEIIKILNNLDFFVTVPKYNAINLTYSVVIMLYTGLRITELLNVKLTDIDGRYMRVHGSKTENADRVVPIHKDIINLIEELKQKNKTYLIELAPNVKIFDSAQYRRYFFKPYMKYLDLNHTPHALRHTFISLMDRCGVSANSVTLKRIVGHSNTSVTESYTHKNLNDLIVAIDKMEIPHK